MDDPPDGYRLIGKKRRFPLLTVSAWCLVMRWQVNSIDGFQPMIN